MAALDKPECLLWVGSGRWRLPKSIADELQHLQGLIWLSPPL